MSVGAERSYQHSHKKYQSAPRKNRTLIQRNALNNESVQVSHVQQVIQ